jgi:hypothetical protein
MSDAWVYRDRKDCEQNNDQQRIELYNNVKVQIAPPAPRSMPVQHTRRAKSNQRRHYTNPDPG